jgi:hypothetical protein
LKAFETICFELNYFGLETKISFPKFTYSLNLFGPLDMCSLVAIGFSFSFSPILIGISALAHLADLAQFRLIALCIVFL